MSKQTKQEKCLEAIAHCRTSDVLEGKLISPIQYTYRVFWSDEVQMFVGICLELPTLSHLGATHQDALIGIFLQVTDAQDEENDDE